MQSKLTATHLGLLLGMIMSSLTASRVQAQSSLDLTVSPPVSYLHVKPGMRESHTITIQNTSAQTVTITPSVHDFSVEPATGLPQLADQHSFKHFVSLAQQLQPMQLEANQKAQLTLAIAPPQNAEEKEYPLSIVFTATSNDLTDQTRLSGSVASNLILLVSSKNQLPKKLSWASTGSPFIIDSFQPLELNPLLKNEGLAATTASGSAVIKNWLGAEVAQFELYPDNVLGFSQRPARGLDPTKPDSTQPISLSYDPQLLLGPYTIELTLNNESGPETTKKTVFALPLLVFVALVGGSAVAVWHWRQEKQRNPFE